MPPKEQTPVRPTSASVAVAAPPPPPKPADPNKRGSTFTSGSEISGAAVALTLAEAAAKAAAAGKPKVDPDKRGSQTSSLGEAKSGAALLLAAAKEKLFFGYFEISGGLLAIPKIHWALFIEALRIELQKALEHEIPKLKNDVAKSAINNSEAAQKAKKHIDLAMFFTRRVNFLRDSEFNKLADVFKIKEDEIDVVVSDSNTIKSFMTLQKRYLQITTQSTFVPPPPKEKASLKFVPKTADAKLAVPAGADKPTAATGGAAAASAVAVRRKTVDHKDEFTQVMVQVVKGNIVVDKSNYERFKKKKLSEYILRGVTAEEKMTHMINVMQVYIQKILIERPGFEIFKLAHVQLFIVELKALGRAQISDDYDFLFFVRNVCLELLKLYKAIGENDYYQGVVEIIGNILNDPQISKGFNLEDFKKHMAWFEKVSERQAKISKLLTAGDVSGVANYKAKNPEPERTLKFATPESFDFERAYRLRVIIFNRIELFLVDADTGRGDFIKHLQTGCSAVKDEKFRIIDILSFRFAQREFMSKAFHVHYLEAELKPFADVDMPLLNKLIDIFLTKRDLDSLVRLDRQAEACKLFFAQADNFQVQKASTLGTAPSVNCVHLFHKFDTLQSVMKVTFTSTDLLALMPYRSKFEYLFAELNFDEIIADVKNREASAAKGGDQKKGSPTGTAAPAPNRLSASGAPLPAAATPGAAGSGMGKGGGSTTPRTGAVTTGAGGTPPKPTDGSATPRTAAEAAANGSVTPRTPASTAGGALTPRATGAVQPDDGKKGATEGGKKTADPKADFTASGTSTPIAVVPAVVTGAVKDGSAAGNAAAGTKAPARLSVVVGAAAVGSPLAAGGRDRTRAWTEGGTPPSPQQPPRPSSAEPPSPDDPVRPAAGPAPESPPPPPPAGPRPPSA